MRPRRRAGAPERERLEHQRALAVQGLRELEFDHEMGKLDEGDYAALKRALEERALAAMAALDRLRASPAGDGVAQSAPALDPGVARHGAVGVADAPPTYPHFCPQCGGHLDIAAGRCPACGAAANAAARRAAES